MRLSKFCWRCVIWPSAAVLICISFVVIHEHFLLSYQSEPTSFLPRTAMHMPSTSSFRLPLLNVLDTSIIRATDTDPHKEFASYVAISETEKSVSAASETGPGVVIKGDAKREMIPVFRSSHENADEQKPATDLHTNPHMTVKTHYNACNDSVPWIGNKFWFEELLAAAHKDQLIVENLLAKRAVWENLSSQDSMCQSYSFRPAKRYFLHKRPRALFYLGWVAYYNMQDTAKYGGPQGEFSLWADVAAGMSAIGFEIVFVSTIYDLWKLVDRVNINRKKSPFVDRTGASTYDKTPHHTKKLSDMFDVIVTDYDGLGTAENIGEFPLNHCLYYIIDYFGTQAAYNTKRNLDLKRILTPYPYDGSNTAVNQVILSPPKIDWENIHSQRKNIGVVWAKDVKYLLGEHKKQLLHWVSELAPLHAFVDDLGNILPELLQLPSSRFINHGYVSKRIFWQYLRSSKFILGVGLPYDGPTALEAIAQGCVYINPVFNPPQILEGHPHRRIYHSQHSFAEEHLSPPHVYTIDTHNKTIVQETILSILHSSTPIDPYVHRLHTAAQFIANMRGILDNQTLCYRNYQSKYDPSDLQTFADNVTYSFGKNNFRQVLSTPRCHPNNVVYEDFMDFAFQRCGVRPQISRYDHDPITKKVRERPLPGGCSWWWFNHPEYKQAEKEASRNRKPKTVSVSSMLDTQKHRFG